MDERTAIALAVTSQLAGACRKLTKCDLEALLLACEPRPDGAGVLPETVAARLDGRESELIRRLLAEPDGRQWVRNAVEIENHERTWGRH